ncbi:hypothetical protein ACLKZ7_20860 [Shewanella algae]|uniref:hypothetical protein n=1 Tax=Shewanella algae TaxID=38313 RepID=UPI003984A11B
MLELVDFIRLFSRHGRLVSLPQLLAVAGDDSEKTVDAVQEYIRLILAPEHRDLKMRISEDEHFFYSDRYMVDSYANRWLALQRGEVAATLAQQIRETSCRHTAVLEASVLGYPPYSLDAEAQQALRQQLLAMPEYDDIRYDTGSDGKGYYFSTDGLSPEYARVLADYDPFEWSC